MNKKVVIPVAIGLATGAAILGVRLLSSDTPEDNSNNQNSGNGNSGGSNNNGTPPDKPKEDKPKDGVIVLNPDPTYHKGEMIYTNTAEINLFKDNKFSSTYENNYEVGTELGEVKGILEVSLIENGVNKKKVAYRVFQDFPFYDIRNNDRTIYVFHEDVTNVELNS